MAVMSNFGGFGLPIGGFGTGAFPQFKSPAPIPVKATGNATHDDILRRLHAIEHQLSKNMQHTEAVVAAAVEHIIKAQRSANK